MRLAFCIFKYFPYGGIQRDLLKILRECLGRGHQVKIYTLRWEGPLQDEVETEIVPIVGLSRHAQYEHFAEVVNQQVRGLGFDLVVGFNKMPGLDVYYGGDSCYLEKALEQRDAWYRLLPRFKSFHAAERAVFKGNSATQILAISDSEIPRYRHHYKTPPRRFHVLPPGIERDRIAPPDTSVQRASVRAELSLHDDHLLLMFIGSGFIKKGLDRALLAVAALPMPLKQRVRLVVIGRDKGDAFERMSMRLGLADQVIFFTDGRDDIPRFLFAADALIHPAYDETAGMVLIEAMLAGLPALATKNCGYAKWLQSHDAGIVMPLPFSQEGLNKALQDLLTSPLRARWSANGLAAKHNPELFELVPKAVDFIEKFAAAKRPLLVFALFRYFPFGGLQRDFMRIALACQRAGYDIFVYCLSWLADIPAGFEVEVVESSAVANHSKHQQFGEYVSRQAKWRRPHAVIGFNKMPGLDLYYAADSCFEHKAQSMRSALYRRTERYKQMSAYEQAVFSTASRTKVMLIAPAQKAQFQQYYQTPEQRLHLLPPGVSRDRCRGANWQQQRAHIRREFDVADDDFLLLLVGSGFITKGLDRAILALANLPAALRARTCLLVIGQDHPEQFLRQARRLGVSDRLQIVRGRDDIPAVLQGADLMVHPAYMESGGLVLIEAVIAGLPVVASAACGFAHYIEKAQAGVVLAEPFDQNQLNRVVANALQDRDQLALWSAGGVDFGRTHKDLYDMPRRALEHIQKVVSELSA